MSHFPLSGLLNDMGLHVLRHTHLGHEPVVTDGSVQALHPLFEGLFVRAMSPDPELVVALGILGFDLDEPRARYPIELWSDCLLVATASLYPTEPECVGLERLGSRFAEAWFETVLGRLIDLSLLPFLSPHGFIEHLPRLVDLAIANCQPTIQWEGSEATLVMRGVDDVVADFFVGAVVAVLARLQVCGVQVYVAEVTPGFSGIRFSFPGCSMPGVLGPG